jgi:hypothetical protein
LREVHQTVDKLGELTGQGCELVDYHDESRRNFSRAVLGGFSYLRDF